MKENSRKILIIDDNEDIVSLLKTMLQIKGYKVLMKMDIIDLEKFIKVTMPDLIIMDMLLSGADGRKICTSLKNNSLFSLIPVLMISAHPHAKNECLMAGADMFIGKPFDVKDFFIAVETILVTEKK
ncbi:MAG: response regulator [Ginsengibacter sp.]|jgi:two-component system alkaline phosphatase synthesis response regulator PhoP